METREVFTFDCPSCGNVLLTMDPCGVHVPGRETWLRDGDTILGIYGRLSPEQHKHGAFWFSLCVGDCPACKKDYYTIEGSFIDADRTDELDDFLCFNARMDLLSNSVCTLVEGPDGFPKCWTLSEYRIPNSDLLMHSHMFGPFSLDSPEGVIHPEYGVMACSGSGADPWEHGEDLILTLFDDLRALVRERTKKWPDERMVEI